MGWYLGVRQGVVLLARVSPTMRAVAPGRRLGQSACAPQVGQPEANQPVAAGCGADQRPQRPVLRDRQTGPSHVAQPWGAKPKAKISISPT